jgi:Gluconate 2-dehydrogenase subunit 3
MAYDVLDKWSTPSWNEQTRRVVAKRSNEIPPRRFFTEREWAIAQAIAARIIPESPVPIVPFIDERLHEKSGKGYRYEDMPEDSEAWRRGLAAIDEESGGFVELSDEGKDEVLRRIQNGEVRSALWDSLPPKRFFTTLLLEDIAGTYYAHPAAWSETGFGGPASPRGYVRLGFDQ